MQQSPRLRTYYFFFQAEDGIRDPCVTGVQTCALPISVALRPTVLLAILTFTAEAFIVAISVTEPGAVVLDAPIDIEDVYLPVVLPITSLAAVGQIPWEAKYSAIGVLAEPSKLTASDTCARAM